MDFCESRNNCTLLIQVTKSHFSSLLVCCYLIIMILPFINEVNEGDSFFLSNMIFKLEMVYNREQFRSIAFNSIKIAGWCAREVHSLKA